MDALKAIAAKFDHNPALSDVESELAEAVAAESTGPTGDVDFPGALEELEQMRANWNDRNPGKPVSKLAMVHKAQAFRITIANEEAAGVRVGKPSTMSTKPGYERLNARLEKVDHWHDGLELLLESVALFAARPSPNEQNRFSYDEMVWTGQIIDRIMRRLPLNQRVDFYYAAHGVASKRGEPYGENATTKIRGDIDLSFQTSFLKPSDLQTGKEFWLRDQLGFAFGELERAQDAASIVKVLILAQICDNRLEVNGSDASFVYRATAAVQDALPAGERREFVRLMGEPLQADLYEELFNLDRGLELFPQEKAILTDMITQVAALASAGQVAK